MRLQCKLHQKVFTWKLRKNLSNEILLDAHRHTQSQLIWLRQNHVCASFCGSTKGWVRFLCCNKPTFTQLFAELHPIPASPFTEKQPTLRSRGKSWKKRFALQRAHASSDQSFWLFGLLKTSMWILHRVYILLHPEAIKAKKCKVLHLKTE